MLTYGHLDRRARALAARLLEQGAEGERVLLIHPFGPDFATSFIACLYAGAVAVPVAPPGRGQSAARLAAIAADCSPRFALTTKTLLPRLQAELAQVESAARLRLLETGALTAGEADPWRPTPAQPDATAFLQYTSGSTSTPRGVAVSHRNLLHNQRLIAAACGHDESSIFLSWLPLYHDLGLIGNLLQALFVGATCHLMSPAAFLQRPRVWLEAISRTRATTSGGPDFAYELCLRRIPPKDRQGLDLSSWKIAFNGAEPVHAETLERFAEAFSPCGFRRASFYPCYGLAESTLMVSGGALGEPPVVARFAPEALARDEAVPVGEGGRSLVSCGGILDGLQALIVDPERAEELPPGRIGEVWIAGESVARAYWNRPEESQRTFGAVLANGRGPFLRSGDLGFFDAGNLYLTGRIKDLIIVRGRNLYPQDLERSARSSHPALLTGGGAAFAVEVENRERVVLVLEVDRRRSVEVEEVAAAVRRALSQEHEVQVWDLVLVPVGGVPRTTSGKIQRRACRDLYLEERLPVLARSSRAEEDEVEEAVPFEAGGEGLRRELARVVARVLRLDPSRLDTARPLAASGMDSLAAFELRHAIETAFGLDLPVAEVLDGASVDDLVAALSERGRGTAAGSPGPLPAVHPGGSAPPAEEQPLAVAQQAFWFLDQMAPEKTAYNIAVAARVEGEVEAGLLRRAFELLVARHACLRTRFISRRGVPMQVRLPAVELDFAVLDGEALTAEELEERLIACAHCPFDLAAGNLLRVALFTRRSGGSVLLFAVHHVVFDGWSFWLLLSELRTLYGALAAGDELHGLPPAGDYLDYLRWQSALLAGDEGERLWAYWRDQLAGDLPEIALPADRLRPVSGPRGGSCAVRVERRTVDRLRGLAGAAGVTPYVTVLGAFLVLLSRSTGQTDLVLGSPAAGRSRPEHERTIGCFFNVLPLRARILAGEPFSSLLERLRGLVTQALAYQDFPSHLLAERLGLRREPGRLPLLQQVTLVWHRPQLTPGVATAGERSLCLDMGSFSLELLPLARRFSPSELELEVLDAGPLLTASLHYREDLLDGATAVRLASQLAVLLEAGGNRSEAPVGALPLLTPAESWQLTGEWNDTQTTDLPAVSVDALIAAQARRTPSAVAVVDGERRLTYAELEWRAGQLAAHLRTLGVGPEARVGILMERSLELIVAVLGVWKAGGAYAPLDPEQPRDRLEGMLADVRAGWVLVMGETAVPDGGSRVIRLDRDAPDLAGTPAMAELPLPTSDRLAYVIYTSGSTGRPKGVMLTHRSLISSYCAWEAAYHLISEVRVHLQMASFSFDVFAGDLLRALGSGGTLVLCPRDVLLDPQSLYDLLRREKVDGLEMVPAVARILIEYLERTGGSLAFLRLLAVGSDLWYGRELAALLRLCGPETRLVSSYGVTEAAIDSSWFEGGATPLPEEAPVPIGRPFANARLFVLDRELRPAPIGVAGELYLAGPGLARGYHDRPDLTAERFVPLPDELHPREAGERLYRTGDLARCWSNGIVELFGRSDDQVKIRGLRIEPGEVEGALRKHLDVQEVAVVATGTAGVDRELAAFVVARRDPGRPRVASAELRSFLRERVHLAMVPAVLAVVDRLPLTPNGKIDRRALAALAGEQRREDEGGRAPRGATQEVLAALWSEMLGVAGVTAEDNFFELGGHSLLAARVAARVREVFPVDLPVSALFEHPRLSGLAAFLDEAVQRGAGTPLPPLEPAADRDGDLPVSFAQERLWFLTQLDPELTAYHVPRAVRLRGRFLPQALAAAFRELVRRHEILRTTFPTVAGHPVQRPGPPRPFPLPLVDLGSLPEPVRERELERLIDAEGKSLFDIERGPLLRALLVRLGVDEHALVQTEHHLVHDGWAEGVLVSEVLTLYHAFAEGRPSPLPEPSLQYADFAVWQRRWLTGEPLEALLAYWRERLVGAPTVLELPADRPAPRSPRRRGGLLIPVLPASRAEGVRALGLQKGATLFMTMLAALYAVLHRYSGQEDFLVATGTANRRVRETEGLLGMVINTLALRADLTGAPTFSALLARVRQDCLGAYAHEDLPFERLVEELRPQRSLGGCPLAQVMFGFLDTPMPELELPGLEIELLHAHNRTAKFDLNLTVMPRSDARRGAVPTLAGGDITILWEYSAELFFTTTMQRMVRHYFQVLEAAVRDPETPVAQLSLLSPEEHHQLLLEENDCVSPFPEHTPLHRLFEARAAAMAGHPAVVYGDLSLSYRELNARANRLARHLLAHGVGPESAVALLTERSCEMVVALLAVLKAGGVYVPLDPASPPERLAQILADASPAFLLTQEKLADRLPAHGLASLSLDAGWSAVEGLPGSDLPSCGETADRLAYIIYTSGSTGGPKGVAVSQRAVNRLVCGSEYLQIVPEDGVAQVSNPAFDAATFEIWGALLNGARLVGLPTEAALQGERLAQEIRQCGITVLFLTTALFHQLAREDPALFAPLRCLLTGGEMSDPRWFQRVAAAASSTRLLHVYGPTEATTFATWHRVSQSAEEMASVPIGRPLSNTPVAVLDPELQPVSLGARGELCIGGPGLARGYVGRPDLTAASFVPAPFATAPGERLYRTGDLCRRRPDGAIEILGRADGQVKIRGFRVELAEIDAALIRHPSVRDAVTVVRGTSADRRLVAYVVPAEEDTLDLGELVQWMRRTLPGYMVPSAFVSLPALPLNSNGKVDRSALREDDAASRTTASEPDARPRTAVEETLARLLAQALGTEAVGRHDNFFDLGAHSLLLARLRGQIEEALQRPVAMVDFFEHPTVVALAEHLDGGRAVARALAALEEPSAPGEPADIAIVGMAGRFPGAASVEELWRNLRAGRESLSSFSEQELAAAGVPAELRRDPRYVPVRGVLDGAVELDAAFFDLSPREAELTDPQQRLFLECAWQALEATGYVPESTEGAIGVYAGVGRNTYWAELLADATAVSALGGLQLLLGNDKDFLATRVAYKLGLRGPALTVQTACSTSLVAVHLAVQALLAGECDMALAGGVSVLFPRTSGYLHEEGGISSPDGRCRAFDASARGTVRGEGVGVVVLKRLARALKDGDQVLAVIKGSAINNDGAVKVGYTAPGLQGQAEVIRAAQLRAGITADSLGYIEAHGTGTPLGDEIELAALSRAFRETTARQGFCALGSIKTNLGHLDAAAGIAGLIKTVLALRHREIPPSLHCDTPRPDLAGSPFFVNRELRAWEWGSGPRRAGVSSFGIGGTNAHVVLEEAPPPRPSSPGRPGQLLVLSARSAAAVDRSATALLQHLESHPDLDLADVAVTLQRGRRAFPERLALVAAHRSEALAALGSRDPGRLWRGTAAASPPSVVFLFPGQGAQFAGMGRDLYAGEPTFRDEVDLCCSLLEPELGFDLRELLVARGEDGEASDRRLAQTAVAQPALFVVEIALARLWMSWGVRPEALLGHSLGEIVAACLAGVFSREDALHVVAARGRLVQELPPGGMLGARLPAAELSPLLGDDLSIAAVNGPARTVVSGPFSALSALEARLTERGIEAVRLRVSHAFHSAMMDPAVAPLADVLKGCRLAPPGRPLLSNVTGTWLTDEQATDPWYWASHLRRPVLFGKGLETLFEREDRILLEVGPGRTLGGLACAHAGRRGTAPVLDSLPGPEGLQTERAALLSSLARLWLAGIEIDWKAVQGTEERRRVELSTYPFERRQYTLSRHGRAAAPLQDAAGRKGPADWFYVPAWRQRPPLVSAPRAARPPRLAFVDRMGLGDDLLARWRAAGEAPVEVREGAAFCRTGEGCYEIDPAREEDYRELFADLARREGGVPGHLVHLWGTAPAEGIGPERFAAAQVAGLASLLALSRALAQLSGREERELVLITSQVQMVTGDEELAPEKATVLGPLKVIPQEIPWLRCRGIDIDPPPSQGRSRVLLLDLLDAELAAPDPAATVAIRAGRRWEEGFSPVALPAPEGALPGLRPGGVYLIVGGLGTVGLAIADRLARQARARLVLTGRTALPPRDAWEDWMARCGPEDAVSRKLLALKALEAAGAEVLVETADAASRPEMARVLDAAEVRFGALHGVIYAAGVPAEVARHPLASTDLRSCEPHFAAKVQGLYTLERLLAGRRLDFCLLCSSLSSLLGGLGFAAYAAANCFMDAFAQAADRRGETPWCSIGWDAWSVADRGRRGSGPGAVLSEAALSAAEGGEAFHRLLHLREVSRVAVSTSDLAARLALWRTPGAVRAADRAVAEPMHTEAERVLRGLWQQLLGCETIGPDDDFFQLGGDSLLGVRLVARLHESGFDLHPVQLFENPTLAKLAAVMSRSRRESGASRTADEALPLTPLQLWLLAGRAEPPPRWARVAALQAQEPLDAPRLGRALDTLAAEQEALRQRFVEWSSQWWRCTSPAGRVPLLVVDLGALAQGELRQRAEEDAARDLRSALDLAAGTLLAAVLLSAGNRGGSRVLVAFHPLVLDHYSVALLPSLLTRGYCAAAGRPEALSTLPQAFDRWSRRLVVERALLQVRGSRATAEPAEPDSVALALDASATDDLLRALETLPRGRIEELVAAALLWAWEQSLGERGLLLDLGCDARQGEGAPPEADRLLGPFTAIQTLRLCPAGRELGDALRTVRRELRSEQRQEAPSGEGARPDILLLAPTAVGASTPASLSLDREIGRSWPREGCGQALEIICELTDRLRIRLDFNRLRFPREAVERLAGQLAEGLKRLAGWLLAEAGAVWEVEDFPLAGLDEKALRELLDGQVGVEDTYPLSPMQHGMLFHALYDSSSQVYGQQLAYALDGPLRVPAFENAWRQAMMRHDTLRTGFRWEGLPRPLQIVYRRAELPWVEEDWRELPTAEQERRFLAWRESDLRRGFDLGRPPLLRCALFRFGDFRYRFVWSHHHLVLDGWSGSLLLQEVLDFYRCEGDVPVRPATGYGRYIAWLERQDTRASEELFRGMLQGQRATTLLPRGAGGPHAFGHQRCELSTPTAQALRAWCRTHGLTLSTVFEAIWALLLSRHSGERTVLFGTTLSGRPPDLPRVESILGLFVNTLPLRVEVVPDEPLLDWLRRLQMHIALLRSHEHTPLVTIQGWSGLPRHEPLFESLVVCEGFEDGVPALREEGLSVEPLPALRSTYHYPLYFVSHEVGSMSLRLTYDTSRLPEETAGQLLSQAVALCEELGRAAAGTSVGDVLAVEAGEDTAAPHSADEKEYFDFHLWERGEHS